MAQVEQRWCLVIYVPTAEHHDISLIFSAHGSFIKQSVPYFLCNLLTPLKII